MSFMIINCIFLTKPAEQWNLRVAHEKCKYSVLLSSGSLPTRQVQMFDVAIPLVVDLVLSASYILPPSSSPASFVLVFVLIFFLAFSLRLPFLTVILPLECVRSTSFVWFLLCV